MNTNEEGSSLRDVNSTEDKHIVLLRVIVVYL